jgi:hypothetical protein
VTFLSGAYNIQPHKIDYGKRRSEDITPLNRALQGAAAGLMPTTTHGAQRLNGILHRQAEIIAYNDDWMAATAGP